MKERRVGTFTLGCMLITFGVLFFIQLMFRILPYEIIFRLWPLVLIFLGGEVLYSLSQQEKIKFHYDIGAILILIMLTGFSMGMAAFDYILRYYEHIAF